MKTIVATLMAILMIVTPSISMAQNAPSSSRVCAKNIGNAKQCMACAVYYEAKSEPKAGQVAVGAVVMNRVKHKNYPATVCGVVYQRGQFTWSRKLPSGSNDKQWQSSLAIAEDVLAGHYADRTGGALFFHSRRVVPSYSKTKRVVAVIGNHVFRK